MERREDGYAVVMTMLIALVVAGLVATMVAMSTNTLRSTRRAGDSANALQVADAGVNFAVKYLTDYTGPLTTVNLNQTIPGTGDKYTVAAKKLSATAWDVDVTGTDARGVQRRVRATAQAQPQFANAVFAASNINFGSGVAVDSFSGGLTQEQTCNGEGNVGTNSPELFDLDDPAFRGGGGGVKNCTHEDGSSTVVVFDGCTAYGANGTTPRFKNEAANATNHACGGISRVTPKYTVDSVDVSSPVAVSATPLDCSTTLNLAPGVYQYPSITLRGGCRIPNSTATQENPVILYTSGAINIGSNTNDVVNAPPDTSCGGKVSATGNDFYNGGDASPLWYYCPGHAGKTVIYGTGSNTLNMSNHVTFFGVIKAKDRVLQGGPHPVIFGAISVGSVNSGAQVNVHYDEALSVLTNGRYDPVNWRECPLTGTC